MTTMHSGLDDITKQRMMQAKALAMEARGAPVGLNLGKKMSVPKDIMMEELNLSANRGSRMFQQRQKRAERFTLENAANGVDNASYVLTQIVPPPQNFQPVQRGKENQVLIIPGKQGLVKGLQKSVAMKGSPDVLAPGYSGPLKETACEKFNTTVIPKSYCSPWAAALGGQEDLHNVLNAELLHNLPPPASYRCFNSSLLPRDGYFKLWLLKADLPAFHKRFHRKGNRLPDDVNRITSGSAAPFGGATASKRAIPVISFEAVESQQLPGIALERMCRRPNFNRAPRGWGVDYQPQSNEL